MTNDDQVTTSSSTATDPHPPSLLRRSQRNVRAKAVEHEQTKKEQHGKEIKHEKKVRRPKKAVDSEKTKAKDAIEPAPTDANMELVKMETNEDQEAISKSTATDPRPPKRRRSQKKPISKAVEQEQTKEEQFDKEIKPKKKKVRGPRKTAKTEMSKDTSEPIATTDNIMELVVAEPVPALLRLPPEIWYQVLSFLPTSLVAPLSLVCTRLLEICRYWPRWRTICHESLLGEPKRKYRSHMALVCSESYYICDLCDGRSTGTGSYGLSGLPLSVCRADDQDHRWRLCKKCRIDYFQSYPDNVGNEVLSKIKRRDELSEYDIIRDLKLKHEELFCFDRRSVGYRSYRRAFYNPHDYMFNEREVTEHAMDVHGGWVGVLAARFRLCSDVLEEYKLRKRLDQLSKKRKAVISPA